MSRDKGARPRSLSEMLWLYVKALWRQWKALLMGGSLIAIALIYSLATSKPINQPWGWGLLGATLFAASFFAWREDHPRRSLPPELTISPKDALWYAVWVRNVGPPARFRAELRIIETNARFHRGESQGPLWWETEQAFNVWLTTGASDWIRLARQDLFTLFRGNAITESASVLLEEGDVSNSSPPFAVFEVTVVSDPPTDSGALTRRYRYDRNGITEGG